MGCTRFLTLLLLLFMLVACAESVVYPSNEGKRTRAMRDRGGTRALSLSLSDSALVPPGLAVAVCVRGTSKFLGVKSSRLTACDSRLTHARTPALVIGLLRRELVTVLDGEIKAL